MSDVTITIQDGGSSAAVQVPGNKIRVKIGCLLTGIGETAVPYQIVPATNATAIRTAFVAGKLAEAAGMVCDAGGTVLAIGVPIDDAGVATAVVATTPGSSTSVVTVTLDSTNGAFDDYNVQLRCTASGTRGTAGIKLKLSLDAGRTEGHEIALGTATTYAIPNTGITLNFAAGTMVSGDYWRFSTAAPVAALSDIQTALTTFQASVYASGGVTGGHIVAPLSGANVTTLQGTLGGSPDGTGGLAAGKVWTRWIVDTVDATTPTDWGGAGQTEAAWMAALESSFASTNSKRVCAAAGAWNMQSPFVNTACGRPVYRRPVGWALDARQSAIELNTLASKVVDGSLSQITVDPLTDPYDGFVYHDERVTPGLAAARFATTQTWIGKPGVFIEQPNLMAPLGSDFSLLPYGLLIDQVCRYVYAAGLNLVNGDLPSQTNGTLEAVTAVSLNTDLVKAVQNNMVAAGQLSGIRAVVDTNWNVRDTGILPVAVTVFKNAYVFNVNITVGYGTGA